MASRQSATYALTTPSSWMITINPKSELELDVLTTYLQLTFGLTEDQVREFQKDTVVIDLTYLAKESTILAKFNPKILDEVKVVKFNPDIKQEAYSKLFEFLNGASKTKKRKIEETVTTIEQSASESEDDNPSASSSEVKRTKFVTAKRHK